jgi:hypothetical protein
MPPPGAFPPRGYRGGGPVPPHPRMMRGGGGGPRGPPPSHHMRGGDSRYPSPRGPPRGGRGASRGGGSESATGGPVPLMAIEAPIDVREAVHHQKEREHMIAMRKNAERQEQLGYANQHPSARPLNTHRSGPPPPSHHQQHGPPQHGPPPPSHYNQGPPQPAQRYDHGQPRYEPPPPPNHLHRELPPQHHHQDLRQRLNERQHHQPSSSSSYYYYDAPPSRPYLKRSSSSSSTSADPYSPSAAKYQAVISPAQQSSIVRSNLRSIQCVDDSQRHQAPPQPRSSHGSSSSSYSRSSSSMSALNHTPTPTLRTIDTSGMEQPRFQHIASHVTIQNSNLRSLPIVQNPSCKVKVSNLPRSVDFGRISQMTTACGGVKTIQVESSTAVIEFMEPSSADKFVASTNRRTVDMSILNVCRI